MNNPQNMDGPEIDTWTNETAEKNTSKDTGVNLFCATFKMLNDLPVTVS